MDRIIKDRYKLIEDFKSKAKDMDRKTFIVEILLEKILDDNFYKKLFSRLMFELSDDKAFFELYKNNIDEMSADFLDYCDRAGFDEYKPLITDEFNTFISSLILGVELFDMNNNKAYRAMLKDIIVAYFNSKDIFKN